MAQIIFWGRVTRDFELQSSENNVPYVHFDVAENIGYGERRHTQYFQVWAWEKDALRLVKSKVKQGSRIWVSGSMTLVDFTSGDGKKKDKCLKVTLDNWGFLPGSGGKQTTNDSQNGTSAPSAGEPLCVGGIDGERDALPE